LGSVTTSRSASIHRDIVVFADVRSGAEITKSRRRLALAKQLKAVLDVTVKARSVENPCR
jgi:transcriptional regulator